ncbi:MAG: hypothetical protein AB7G07_15030, partial [Bauldia sp.]
TLRADSSNLVFRVVGDVDLDGISIYVFNLGARPGLIERGLITFERHGTIFNFYLTPQSGNESALLVGAGEALAIRLVRAEQTDRLSDLSAISRMADFPTDLLCTLGVQVLNFGAEYSFEQILTESCIFVLFPFMPPDAPVAR